MARRPLPEMVRLTARVPRGEAGFWSIMLALDARGPWAVPDVEAESNVKPGGVAQYLRKLVKAGIARQTGTRPAPARPCKLYRLAKRPREAPRLKADGGEIGRGEFERLWCAMRALKQFSLAELAFAAATDTDKVKLKTAERYVHALVRAGYLASLGGGAFRLKPSMNTGPLPPAILRLRVVWDRNEKRVMGEEHVLAEEAAR